jgi:NADH:ubiquinone oxidoreductase subunit K
MIPLWMYLVVAAGLFCIGTYGVLARRNAVAVLMGVELMLNAVNINLVGFWRSSSWWPRLKRRLVWRLSSRSTGTDVR